MRRLLKHTVFSRPDEGWALSNEMLAVYFHRSAATMYMLYFVWAVVKFGTYLPVMHLDTDVNFGDLFPLYIVPVALAACIGATFFPKLGRLEMFAASALVPLVLVYIIIGIVLNLDGLHPVHWDNVPLNLVHLVVPAARVVFIVRTLVWNAAKRGGKY